MNVASRESAGAAKARPMPLSSIGGILEGVSARSPHWFVGVCRRLGGGLVAAYGRVEPIDAGAGSWPFVRGLVCQLRQWSPPVSPLAWSASLQEGGEDDAATAEHDILSRRELPREAGGWSNLISSTISFTLLMTASQLLAAGVVSVAGVEMPLLSTPFQIVTGVIAIGLVVLYMRLVARVPETRRIMQYNTAAMKVLATHDAGIPLSVASVHGQAPFHPDAAANYIALLLVLLPAMFHAVSLPLAGFTGSRAALHATFIALKVAALPVLFALVFELQRLAVRAFRASGGRGPWAALCVMQRAVIDEPDDGQIEVAVLAVQEAMTLEAEGEPRRGDGEGRAERPRPLPGRERARGDGSGSGGRRRA